MMRAVVRQEIGDNWVYDNLINGTALACVVVIGLAVLYLLLGLISPTAARARGRGRVVLRFFLAVLLAFGAYAGVIVYTHMQPDGPHSIEGYIRDYDFEQHRQQPAAAPAPEVAR